MCVYTSMSASAGEHEKGDRRLQSVTQIHRLLSLGATSRQ